jgi:hypothetical protein
MEWWKYIARDLPCHVLVVDDVQNQTIILANYSTTLCEGASIITIRQRNRFSAFADKLDSSSRRNKAALIC